LEVTASKREKSWNVVSGKEEVKLYDLSTDVAETKSIANENRAVALALMDQLTEYRTLQEILLKGIRSEQTDSTVRMDAR